MNCQTGGKCVEKHIGYTCDCTNSPYEGPFCKKGKKSIHVIWMILKHRNMMVNDFMPLGNPHHCYKKQCSIPHVPHLNQWYLLLQEIYTISSMFGNLVPICHFHTNVLHILNLCPNFVLLERFPVLRLWLAHQHNHILYPFVQFVWLLAVQLWLVIIKDGHFSQDEGSAEGQKWINYLCLVTH